MIIYQDDELFYRLLTEGIVQLSAIGEVYVSDALKKSAGSAVARRIRWNFHGRRLVGADSVFSGYAEGRADGNFATTRRK